MMANRSSKRTSGLLLKGLMFSCSFLFLSFSSIAQNGSYEKKNANGSYCVISFEKNADHIKAEFFAWWNGANDQTGYYNGSGILKGNSVILTSDENDPECKVTLTLDQGKIKASYRGCATDHLTEDFNGTYLKISEALAGDYTVKAEKTYFHKTADNNTRLQAYVLKGDTVTLDMDNLAASKSGFVFVAFRNKSGKDTFGYVRLADLKRKN